MHSAALPFVVYMLSQYVPADPTTILWLRIAFAVCYVGVLYAVVSVRRSIMRRNEVEEQVSIVTKVKKGKGKKATTESQTEVLTVQAYDLREWRSLVQSSVGGMTVLAAMSYFFPSMGTSTLLFGIISNPLNFADAPLVRIHLMKHGVGPHTGLTRPFSEDAGMMEALNMQMKELKAEVSGQADAERRAAERAVLERKLAAATVK